MKSFLILCCLVVVGSLCVGSTVFAYSSGTYGSGTYGSCEYGSVCSITLISNGNVSLDVTPTPGGSCTIQSDTASVLTDDTNGYTLMLAGNGTDTALRSGASSIGVTNGTLASPTTLANNTWGYRVDQLGSFGAGPTTSHSSVGPSGSLFASIKANDVSADIIATTSVAANPAVTTTVWYGVCADTAVSSGAYSTQVTYTAVAN